MSRARLSACRSPASPPHRPRSASELVTRRDKVRAVVPAEAGTYDLRPVFMGSRFPGDDRTTSRGKLLVCGSGICETVPLRRLRGALLAARLWLSAVRLIGSQACSGNKKSDAFAPSRRLVPAGRCRPRFEGGGGSPGWVHRATARRAGGKSSWALAS